MDKKILLITTILLMGIITAQSIDVTYPPEVNIEEEFNFNVKLIDFPTDTYDVKIDILYNENRIARILSNQEWKSTYYYINDVIALEKDFTIKITEDFTQAEITIKIRDSSGNSETFTNYPISKATQEVVEEVIDEPIEETIPEVEEIVQGITTITGNVIEEVEEIVEEPEETNIIVITNTKDIKTEEIFEEPTKESKNNFAKYGLVSFGIVIALLLLLKRKKYTNEFR